MSLKYARISNIIARLASRITIVDSSNVGVNLNSITGSSVGTDLVLVLGEAIEEMISMYLGMLYELPLKNDHAFLSNIAEKLIISDIYNIYFPTGIEGNNSQDGFSNMLRIQALQDLQSLFNGTGIFVAGAEGNTVNEVIQNDAQAAQMQNKALILPGESLKGMIGYDFNADSISDTDIFKLNTNISPSFYTVGNFEDYDEEVINGIRVRERYNSYNKPEVDFYSR